VLVSNEGNARMSTTLPRVHVAVAGIDKVVPDIESLTVLLKLLARSATGQKLSTYTTFITGPRRDPAEHGPEELHLVLLDNGRTQALRDEVTRETLLCIRCGACLNVCPVYNNVGGHAYGWVYSGPIGALLAPQLLGTAKAASLAYASTLCGACDEVCPVQVPLTEILLRLRRRAAEGDEVDGPVAPLALRAAATTAETVLSTPALYQAGAQAAALAQAPLREGDWLPRLPAPVDRWTMVRPLPAFRPGFRAWFRARGSAQPRPDRRRAIALAVVASLAATGIAELLRRRMRGGPR
jgi:L-lactate dehydrogenase complex protein LldF